MLDANTLYRFSMRELRVASACRPNLSVVRSDQPLRAWMLLCAAAAVININAMQWMLREH